MVPFGSLTLRWFTWYSGFRISKINEKIKFLEPQLKPSVATAVVKHRCTFVLGYVRFIHQSFLSILPWLCTASPRASFVSFPVKRRLAHKSFKMNRPNQGSDIGRSAAARHRSLSMNGWNTDPDYNHLHLENQFSKMCQQITDTHKRILRTLSISTLKWVQHITGYIPGSPWTHIVIYSPFSTISTLRPSEVEFRTSAEWNPTSMHTDWGGLEFDWGNSMLKMNKDEGHICFFLSPAVEF